MVTSRSESIVSNAIAFQPKLVYVNWCSHNTNYHQTKPIPLNQRHPSPSTSNLSPKLQHPSIFLSFLLHIKVSPQNSLVGFAQRIPFAIGIMLLLGSSVAMCIRKSIIGIDSRTHPNASFLEYWNGLTCLTFISFT